MTPPKKIAKVVKKISLAEQGTDYAFWQTQPYALRLEALEEIRQEYHRWRGDVQPGLERVYRIVKR